MRHQALYILLCILATCVVACSDDDSFTSSSSNLLTFSTDTLSLDTVFSNVPSAAKSFWVYNHSGDGLRCTSLRLENGATSGFRVNVDGQYLGADTNYSISDVEVRNKDSIRVFVELTAPSNQSIEPQQVSDNLVFTLESGVEQRVNLTAYSWDAILLQDVHITSDSTMQLSEHPIIIYGGIDVDSAATLTLSPGLTLYFHGGAGLRVKGTLVSNGTAEQPVTLRGDRIDRMFDYLPYDYVPGQWEGVHFYASSYNNVLSYTDIHSTFDGVVADSSDVNRLKLTMANSTIHNCQGNGLYTRNNQIVIENSQITNTLGDCLHVEGGDVQLNNCTIAQFYPFDGNRGQALYFTNSLPLVKLTVFNSLITGYADDVLTGSLQDGDSTITYLFNHCILRTPKVETADSVYFQQVEYEDVEDTVKYGYKQFKLIDTDNLRYNFALDSLSAAIDKADAATALPIDRLGIKRDDQPDIGAFEYQKTN